jgi:hypothetical protein
LVFSFLERTSPVKIALLRFGRGLVNAKIPNVTAAEEVGLALDLKALGHEPVIYSNWMRGHERDEWGGIPFASVIDWIEEVNSCDAMLMFNCTVNFFGGAEHEGSCYAQRAFCQFPGPVAMVVTDPLCLNQAWKYGPRLPNHPWLSRYPETEYFALRGKRTSVITNFRDLDKVRDTCARKVSWSCVEPFDFLDQGYLTHFRFTNLDAVRTVDLGYGGSGRTGKREDQLREFYFGHGYLDVRMCGTISQKNFSDMPSPGTGVPAFMGKTADYFEYLDFMRSCFATVLTCDEWYEDNCVPARLVEAAVCGTIPLIDREYDSKGLFVRNDPLLEEHCYVSCRKDVSDKIRQLRANPQLAQEIRDRHSRIWVGYPRFLDRQAKLAGILRRHFGC